MNTLFITEVGSRMWSMNTLSSDHDLVEIYQCPTKRILRGESVPNTRPMKQYLGSDSIPVDYQAMEIGHLINLLIKGNINAIWAVTSPKKWYTAPLYTHDRTTVHDELITLVIRNLSKKSYMSIYGMAESQYRDSVKRADVRDPLKSKLTALRTLLFGIRMLEYGTLDYTVGKDLVLKSDDQVTHAFMRLKQAHANSRLHDEPHEDVFREFLYDVRTNVKW